MAGPCFSECHSFSPGQGLFRKQTKEYVPLATPAFGEWEGVQWKGPLVINFIKKQSQVAPQNQVWQGMFLFHLTLGKEAETHRNTSKLYIEGESTLP